MLTNNCLFLSCLVLKVSRRQGEEQGNPQVTVAGKVSRFYRFNSLADYQYLPVDPLGCARSNLSPLSSEVSGLQEDLLIIPPIFSRHDAMQDYSFKPCKAPAEKRPRIPSPQSTKVPVGPARMQEPSVSAMQVDGEEPYDILED